MNSINSLNDKNFTLNGIQYFRNYVSAVHGNKIELYNCYERKDVLVPLTHFSEFKVNGTSYTSAAALQAALLDVTYSRLTGGDSSIIDQNNTGRTIDAGFVGPAPNYVPVYSVVAAVAEKLNAMEIVITAKETPVIITASLLAEGPNGLSVTKIYKYLFKPGKGNWGQNGTTISTRHLEEITIRNYLIDDLLGQSNAVIENLGAVADGNFIAKANASNWNFYDLGTEGGAGQKTYYFSYETDDVLYFAQFTGTPGLYGVSYTNKFTANDFVSSTDSRITDIPNLEKILEQGGNKNISQLINNGDGTSPFSTEAAVNGLTVTVNQAAAEMYLKNSEGTILATVNLAFLNNEGTTFFYNETTEKLELKNDAGEVLSQVPVSAFVSNLMQSVEFNGSNQSLLEFKDATGNIVDSVAVTINNIQGLQAALNTKANANGSNATGFWPIGVNSASTATQTEQFGGAYGDFLNDGNGITHVAGYDSNQTRVKRYTLSSFKLWLAMAITDISGLVTALANMTAAIGLKADKADTLTFVSNIAASQDLNTFTATGIYIQRSNASAANGLNYPVAMAGKLEVVGTLNYLFQIYHSYATANTLYIRTKYLEDWSAWRQIIDTSALIPKANDTEVVHRTGNETLNGTKIFTEAPIVPAGTLATHTVSKGQLDALSTRYLALNSNGGGLTQLGPTADANSLNTMVGYGGSNVINFPTSGSILSMMFTDGMFGGQLHIAANSQSVTGGVRYRSRYSGVNSVWEQLAERSWVTVALATAANNVATNYVPSSGASTIGGTKTFTDAPVVPAGTLAAHAINKGQLDLKSNDSEVLHKLGNITESVTGQKTFNDNLGIGGAAVNTWRLKLQGQFGISSINTSGESVWELYNNAKEIRHNYGFKLVGYSGLATGQTWFINGVDGSANFTGKVTTIPATNANEVVIKSQLDSGIALAANNVASGYVPSIGASTVAGTKTFTEAPVVPVGTLAVHAVNKAQLDLKADAASVVTTNTNQGSIGGDKTWIGAHTWDSNSNALYQFKRKIDVSTQSFAAVTAVAKTGAASQDGFGGGIAVQIESSSSNGVQTMASYRGVRQGNDTSGSARVATYLNGVDTERLEVSPQGVTKPINGGTLQAPAAVLPQEVIIKSQLDSGLNTAANNVASNYIPSSGASAVNGTKTFTEAPVVPAGTIASHAVNKGQLDLKANDTDVLHKTGNETKNGNLIVTGTMQCYLYQGNSTGNHIVFNNTSTPNEISSALKTAGTSGWRITDARGSGTDNIIDIVKGATVVASVKTNGTIKATGATNTDEVIIKSQLDSREATVYNNIASTYVPLTGASTITGTKTFVNAPIVPTPTLAGHPVNKALFDAWTDNADKKLSNLEGGNDYAIDNTYNGTSGWFTALNAMYPTAKKGFTVYAIGSGEKYMCKKLSDNQWIIHAGIIGIVTAS